MMIFRVDVVFVDTGTRIHLQEHTPAFSQRNRRIVRDGRAIKLEPCKSTLGVGPQLRQKEGSQHTRL